MKFLCMILKSKGGKFFEVYTELDMGGNLLQHPLKVQIVKEGRAELCTLQQERFVGKQPLSQ